MVRSPVCLPGSGSPSALDRSARAGLCLDVVERWTLDAASAVAERFVETVGVDVRRLAGCDDLDGGFLLGSRVEDLGEADHRSANHLTTTTNPLRCGAGTVVGGIVLEVLGKKLVRSILGRVLGQRRVVRLFVGLHGAVHSVSLAGHK